MKAKGLFTATAVFMLTLAVSVTSIGFNTVDVQAAKASNMKVESYEGKVTLKNSKGKAKSIKTGTRLLNGDNLSTNSESLANILLDSTKAVLVEESSSVSVKQAGKELDLTVDKGSVFFDVSKKLTAKESFEIKTSNMVCGIRGTVGEVKTETNKKKKTVQTQIYLLEGQVKVTYNATKKKKATKTIKSGQKLTLTTDTKTGKCTPKISKVAGTDIKKSVAEKIQSNDTLISRVESACPIIDWSKTIEDAITGKNETGTVIYECVYFGNYWQIDNNGDGVANKADDKTPIKWRVLNKSGDKALVVADKIMDCLEYNEEEMIMTWADCSMRSWLNGEFINNAFSASEQSAIIETEIANKDNQCYGTAGGAATKDKVFLLSLEEISNPDYGFSNYNLKQDKNGDAVGKIGSAVVRDYAKLRLLTDFVKGGDTADGSRPYENEDSQASLWWLRSPGSSSYKAAIVESDGGVYGSGMGIVQKNFGVVPALYIDLASTEWQAAGTVTIKSGSFKTLDQAISYQEAN